MVSSPNAIWYTLHNDYLLPSDDYIVNFHYSMANTGQVWPDQWQGFSYNGDSINCPLGKDIGGTAAISVAPQSSYTHHFVYNAPNFVHPE